MTSPDQPEERPFPTETAAQGPWGGPVYSYRGAEIRCNKGGHVCTLPMEGHPLDGAPFGVVGTVTPLIDLWVEEGRLPRYMRAAPMADGAAPRDRKYKPPGRGAPGGSMASAPRRVGPAADRAGDTPPPRGRLRACDAAGVSSAPRGWPWRRQRPSCYGFPFVLYDDLAMQAGAAAGICHARKHVILGPALVTTPSSSAGRDRSRMQHLRFLRLRMLGRGKVAHLVADASDPFARALCGAAPQARDVRRDGADYGWNNEEVSRAWPDCERCLDRHAGKPRRRGG